jgi:hypothetical protein
MNRIDIIGAVDDWCKKASVIVPFDVDRLFTVLLAPFPDLSHLPCLFSIGETAAKALKADNSGIRRRDLRGHDTLAKGLGMWPESVFGWLRD